MAETLTTEQTAALALYALMIEQADGYTAAIVAGDQDAAERIGAEAFGADVAAMARQAGEALFAV
jgi:hypothetical protein